MVVVKAELYCVQSTVAYIRMKPNMQLRRNSMTKLTDQLSNLDTASKSCVKYDKVNVGKNIKREL